jgi:DnaK suppressor protein
LVYNPPGPVPDCCGGVKADSLGTGVFMKKKDLDQLKKLLEDEKRRILRHLEDISDTSVSDLDTPSGDSVDIAALEINQNSLVKVGKRELNHLKKIDAALQKMEDGSYGECESCGEQIAVARLQARPVAQLCIDCKTAQEKEERKYTDRSTDEESDSISEDGEDL